MSQFYEFFAGGGMARAGLGTAWVCLFANDFDYKKSRIYAKNWGRDVIKTADVRTLTPNDLPGRADLTWASFPCQDLSLAGSGAGLKGDRSGTFLPFWRLTQAVIQKGSHRSSSCLKMFAARSPHTMGKTSRRFAPSSNKDESGCKVQRAEIRFDDMAGCLRTPGWWFKPPIDSGGGGERGKVPAYIKPGNGAAYGASRSLHSACQLQ